jgi:phosphatidylserine decarboxylase
MNFLKTFIPNIHKEGIIFVVIAIVVTVVASFISPTLTTICGLLTLFILYFFRDPAKITPLGDNLIVSPADGTVTKVEEVSLPSTLGFDDGEKTIKISIFLSVFDIHVNRSPADGEVLDVYYHHGKFLSATLDKSSVENERNEVLLKMKDGNKIVFTQIAGLIARRIVCDIKKGDEIKAGSRYGIIRFGSRVDVYLPKGVHPLVFEGQKMIGGETILADNLNQTARYGEIR